MNNEENKDKDIVDKFAGTVNRTVDIVSLMKLIGINAFLVIVLIFTSIVDFDIRLFLVLLLFITIGTIVIIRRLLKIKRNK